MVDKSFKRGEFLHYLITRFNIPNHEWRTSIEESGTQWDEWMKDRIELFRSYCLPSVLNQKNNRFTWIICIDPNTKEEYKSYFETIKSKKEETIIMEVSDHNNLTERLNEYIINDTKNEGDYIITSRLDNDDAIGYMFIDRVQNQFNQQSFEPILFSRGYQLVFGTDSKYVKDVNLPKGPFISVIEKRSENISTVFAKPHTQWNLEKVKILNRYPSWLQLIHEKNIANSEAIGRTLMSLDTEKKFGFDEKNSLGLLEYLIKLLGDLEMNTRKKIFQKRKKWGGI